MTEDHPENDQINEPAAIPKYKPANPNLDINAAQRDAAHVANFQARLGPESIGGDAIILCDHDGPDGRWVGEFVEIVDYEISSEFPFRVRSSSGATMWCSVPMLGPIR